MSVNFFTLLTIPMLTVPAAMAVPLLPSAT